MYATDYSVPTIPGAMGMLHAPSLAPKLRRQSHFRGCDYVVVTKIRALDVRPQSRVDLTNQKTCSWDETKKEVQERGGTIPASMASGPTGCCAQLIITSSRSRPATVSGAYLLAATRTDSPEPDKMTATHCQRSQPVRHSSL